MGADFLIYVNAANEEELGEEFYKDYTQSK